MRKYCAWSYCILLLGLLGENHLAAAETGRALVRHAPSINGTVDGDIQQMTAEAAALNGGTVVTGNWLVPGSPKINLNGAPNYGGTLEGSGATTPSNYTVKLNGEATLDHIIRRSDPVTLPVVDVVPTPTGTASVTVSSAGQSITWGTLRNLTLLGGVGQIQMPAGTYGDITANGGSGLILGVAGATQPSVYNFQNLTLNGNCTLSVLGPVVINLANGFAASGTLGAPGNASLLAINVRSGGVTLNGRCNVYGYLLAPTGEVKIEGNGQLIGGLISDRLTVLGNGLLRLQVLGSANHGPAVVLTAPIDGSTFTVPVSFVFAATASDPDGTISKVEFFEGTTKLGEAANGPYTYTLTGVSVGTHTYFARATDNDGVTADSVPVSITVNNPNQPPTVTLTAPSDGAIFTAPATISLVAAATDIDGTVSLVEFYEAGIKIGESATAPYGLPTAPLSAGTYIFSAKAFDNLGAAGTSASITVTVVNPNQPPSVTITAPTDGSTYDDPAAITLHADAADTDGTVTKVEFLQNGVLLGEDLAAPYEFPVTGLMPGTYDFVARATDNANSATDSAAVRIVVGHVNDAPVATDLPVSTAEDTPLAIALTATDPDGDTLAYSIVVGPQHGSVAPNPLPAAPNSFTYTPAVDFHGTDSFTFKASDGALESNVATVTITVTPVNDAPEVNAGADQAVNLPAYGVLAGTATDRDGDALTFTWSSVSGPSTPRFEFPNALNTRVEFLAPGVYTLRLTASDGAASGFDDVVVTVNQSTLVFRTYTTSADFNEGVNSNVNTEIADQLQLNGQASAGHFLWVAVSSKGTVVKINTRTGRIEGEYWTSPNGQPKNPSRTTVDLNGAVWCSNRDGNSVIQIGSVESGLWIDKNGNGQPDTSIGQNDIRSWSNAAGADTNGGVATAEDECIIHYVRTTSGGTRHLSLDKNNNIWVSGTGSRAFDLIENKTGSILRTEGPVGYGGYGGLMDRNGVLWSTTWGSLLRWDVKKPLSGPAGTNWSLLAGGSQYGLGIGPDGYIWSSTLGPNVVYKYAPDGQLVGQYTQGNGNAQGITVDKRGHVWVAHSTSSSTVGHLLPNGTWLGNVTVGSGPTGVAVDGDGKIWATNFNSGTVSRIDPNAGSVGADGVTPVGLVDFTSPYLGGNPYNYSDMTGSTLVAPPLSGVWTVVYDSGKAATAWGSINWHAKIYDDSKLTITVCSSVDGVTFSPWRVGVRGQDLDVPNGRYLKTNVLFQRSSTGHSPILYDLTVGEEGYLPAYPFNTAPEIEAPSRQAASYGVEAKLQAKVGDDGLPHPPSLSFQWSKVSGPGAVTFDSATRVDATAQFATVGNYVLRLTTTDGALSATADVNVIANLPPTANAGPDMVVRESGSSVNLQGSVYDDSASLNGLISKWRQLQGPDIAVIADPSSPTTGVTFPAIGRYFFELSVTDGWADSTDTMEVRVGPPAPAGIPRDAAAWWPFDLNYADVIHGHVAVPTAAVLGEGYAGAALALDGTSSVAIAEAHSDLDVGSSPLGMSVEMWVFPTVARDTPLVMWGTPTSEAVSVRSWYYGTGLYAFLKDTSNVDHTMAINGVFVANQWQHVAVTYDRVTGIGRLFRNGVMLVEQQLGIFTPQTTQNFYIGALPRESRYFKGSLDEVTLYRRPLTPTEVTVLYQAGAIGKPPATPNQAPVVNAGPDKVLAAPGSLDMTMVVTDDGLPAGSGLRYAWRAVSGPAQAQIASPTNATSTVTFPQVGTYVLEAVADDGFISSSDFVEIRVGVSTVETPPAIKAWWPLNGHPHEVVNGNHDFDLFNGVTYGAGQVSQGLVFDGANDFVRTAAHSDLNIGASTVGLTIEMWVKPTTARDVPLVMWANATGEAVSLREWYYGAGLYAFLRDTANVDHTIGVNNVFVMNQWQHVAITYDKATGWARLFRNGIQLLEQNIGIFTPKTDLDVYAGALPREGRYFQGSLDEITFYHRALSATEVTEIYQAGASGKSPLDNNAPPVVDAGPDIGLQTTTQVASLNGNVTDDGLALATPTVLWSKVDGPGGVDFGASTQKVTTATFTAPGTYVLRLTANDGLVATSDDVEVRIGMKTVQSGSALAAWWPLNAHAHDVISGNHEFELLNATTYGEGKVSQGMRFDGGDDFMRTPAHADLDVGTDERGLTIEMWVYPTAARDVPLVMWANQTTEAVSLRQWYYGLGLYAYLRDTANVDHAIGVNNVFVLNQWQHVAVTYDKVTGWARLYRNGYMLSEQNLGVFTPRTNLDFYAGALPREGRYFQGGIDEIALHRRPLSNTEIIDLYNAGVSGRSPLGNNLAPVVDAGPNLSITSTSDTATLYGIVVDDGKPVATPSVQWTFVDGPAVPTIASPASETTTVTFSAAGTYVFKLSGYDGLLEASDLVEVRVGVTTVDAPDKIGAWWPLNAHPHEVINGRHDFEFFRGVSYGLGKISEGLLFDGSDDFVRTSAHTDLDVGASTEGMTMELWVYPTAARDVPLVMWSNQTTEAVSLRMWYYGVGLYAFFRDTNNTDHTIGVNNVFTLNQWQHIAATYNKATGMGRLYRNGVLLAEQNLGIFTPRTNLDFYAGALPREGRYFQGTLDEITLYARPLSGAEISTLAAAGAGKTSYIPNLSPVVAAGSDKSVYINQPVTLVGTASDDGLPNPPAALTQTWSKVSGPGNATFSSPNALTTTAKFDVAGSYVVRLTASDSVKTGTDDVTITVLAPPSNPPSIEISSPANGATVPANVSVMLMASASDTDGTIASVEFYRGSTKIGNGGAVVGSPGSYGLATTFSASVQPITLTAVAIDNSGAITTSTPVVVTVGTYTGSPVASLVTPDEDTRISEPTAINGVVFSSILNSWRVEYRLKVAAGETLDPWRTLATGTTNVGTPESGSSPASSGLLGTFDPSLLINGIYEIQLVVSDTVGNSLTDGPRTVVVEGNMKVGAFSLAFEDLKVPLSEIPITVTRTYDSRDPRIGDFGPGWRMALNNVRVQKNTKLSIGWEQVEGGFALSQVFYINPLRKHIVTVTMPDGETHRFEAGIFVPRYSGTPAGLPDNYRWLAPITEGSLKFYPIGDTTSTLALDGNDSYEFSGHVGEEYLTDGVPGIDDPVEPTRFRLTTKDGATYILDERLGLLEMRDLSGNKLALQRDAQNRVTGITSTQAAASGSITRSVTVHRDTNGRIDYITDPANQQLDYLYDAQGRLESFTDRENNTTQFRYENASFPYYLTKIIDPRGVSALRIEFDESGRIFKQIDADGKETIFTHAIAGTSRYEKIKDRLGKETTFYYDERGNVTLKIDPLGAQTSYDYYPDTDRVKFETDHYGNVISKAYDSQGNVTVETVGANKTEDPASPTTGHATWTTYNSYSAPTQIKDPDGRTQKFTYDATTNNLLTHTIGFGGSAPATTTYTYYDDGTPYKVTDALSNVTTNTYNYLFSSPDYPGAVKQITATVTDPAATVLRTTRTIYDAQENVLATIVTRTLPQGGTEDVVTKYVYDTENRLKAAVMPGGQVTETRYTSFGQTDKTVIWKSLADYQSGNEGAARVTSYGYDNRGNQVSTSYPDGTSESTNFDLENRREWSQDRLGRRTYFKYDDVGRLRFTIQPDATPGDLTDNPYAETVYDLVGRVTDNYDELRHRTHIDYYPDGTADAGRRKHSVQILSTGNLVTSYQYDGAGNVRYVTDPRGNTVETQYDDHGRAYKVVYPATDENPSTSVTTNFDALGRRIGVIDQDGKVTRYRFDGLGRLFEVRQYIDQAVASSDADFSLSASATGIAVTHYSFDEIGNKLSQTDARGNTTNYQYDSLGRRTKRILPDTSFETLQYDDWGNLWKRTDFAGKTTTFGYDALNRLKSKTADAAHSSLVFSHAIARVEYDYDNNGARTAARTYNTSNTLLYSESTPRDERGRVESKTTASATLSYHYYANGLLEDIVSSNSGGVNLGYRYDDANRLAFVDDGSSGAVKTTGYSYNANGSLETVATPNGVTHTYGYDSLNRLRNLALAKSLAGIRSYDYQLYAGGHRKKIVESTGRTLDYVYDGLNRLTSETSAGGPTGTNGTVGYTLDKVGNRLARTSTVTGLAIQSATFNARDQLDSETYDANGNTTVSVGVTGQPDVYDFEDRLIVRRKPDGSTINLAYDGDGIRILKTLLDTTAAVASTTAYVVDTNNLTGYAQILEESKSAASGTSKIVYAYGSDLISQAVRADAQPSTETYFGYDGLGSVRQLTDATGAVTDTWDYDAFGNIVSRTGSTSNAYLYRGEQFDADLGMYSLRARFYNQATGRFWTQDSYEGNSGDPASLHKYLYANADPVRFSDPSGRLSLGETAMVGAIVGTLAKLSVVSYRAATGQQYTTSAILKELAEGAGYGALGAVVAFYTNPVILRIGATTGWYGVFGAGTAAGTVSAASVALFREFVDFYILHKPTTFTDARGRVINATAGGFMTGGLFTVIRFVPKVAPSGPQEVGIDPISGEAYVFTPYQNLGPAYYKELNDAANLGAVPKNMGASVLERIIRQGIDLTE